RRRHLSVVAAVRTVSRHAEPGCVQGEPAELSGFHGCAFKTRRMQQLTKATTSPHTNACLLGDRSWKHKRMFYRVLSADTVEEQETIKAELSDLGVNLSKEC